MDTRVYLESEGIYVATEPLSGPNHVRWIWAYRYAAELIELGAARASNVRVASTGLEATPIVRVRYYLKEEGQRLKSDLESFAARAGGG
jgi:hypothetical protein